MSGCSILCVDDEKNILRTLKRMLEEEGYTVFTALYPKDAFSYLEKDGCQVALIDYKMPGMNGVELIEQIVAMEYPVVPIILTAYGDVPLVVEAMRAGAFDYLTKPWDHDLLIATIEKAFEHFRLLNFSRTFGQHARRYPGKSNLVGASASLLRIYDIIDRVRDSDANVLISGESGTGKEEIAKTIHYTGKRADKPFIPVDCSSLNPNVIESELFGHKRGAFTGAFQEKQGLFKAAGKGTIFLDEIAEIPLNIQVKLLRALQEMEFKPVGGTVPVKIGARILAATNKDIYRAIEDGDFREDLFYRLNVVMIISPPLREHREDIPLLADYFIRKYGAGSRKITGISADALGLMMKYHWPGNVRQLENCIERAATMGSGSIVTVADLPKEVLKPKDPDEQVQTLKQVERQHILRTLIDCKGNKRLAARLLGIGKSTLYNKLQEYNIQ